MALAPSDSGFVGFEEDQEGAGDVDLRQHAERDGWRTDLGQSLHGDL